MLSENNKKNCSCQKNPNRKPPDIVLLFLKKSVDVVRGCVLKADVMSISYQRDP